MTPLGEVQTLSPGALVTLYELDATGIGGVLSRYAPMQNRLGANIVFQGNTYQAFPIAADGFERTTEGPIPTPKLRIANLNGVPSQLCRELHDLVGAIVRRRITLEKFLDAVNFPGGVNPTAGAYEYQPETWIINQKTAENRDVIEFELKGASDVNGMKLPGRPMNVDHCAWTSTSDCIHVNVCAKRFSDCKANWGTAAELPFGAFSGLSRVR